MAIDWFTVIAQLVNFLVLVLLLQRFLYKPVLHAVAEREQKIAAQLANAAAKEKTALDQWQDYQFKDAALKHEAGAIMDKALTEARAERERLMTQAHKDADAQRAAWSAALVTEQENYGNELERQVQDTVLDVTRKLVADIAGSTLEANMVRGFVGLLDALGPDEKKRLTQAAGHVLIRSSRALDHTARTAIHQALKAQSTTLPDPTYETDASIACGIGLYVDGYRLEWSIDNYLRQLGEALPPAQPAREPSDNLKKNT